MHSFSRREVLKAGVAAGALAGVGELKAERATATDWVVLGKSEVKVTRLAFGTGTFSGQVQQGLGQDGFTRLVRYAYDRGIRFFETSDTYGQSQQMLGIALKGLPRDSYRLMSKLTTDPDGNPGTRVEELLANSQADYFDIMLLHFQHVASWPTDTVRWQDAILEAERKQLVLSHGASVHGLPALRQVPETPWLDIAMIRMNHKGSHMDTAVADSGQPGNVPEVVQQVKLAKARGLGVISMKLIGEGTFNHEDRQKAMRFAFRNAGVDCVTVGYKSPSEIDEAIDNLNLALT